MHNNTIRSAFLPPRKIIAHDTDTSKLIELNVKSRVPATRLVQPVKGFCHWSGEPHSRKRVEPTENDFEGNFSGEADNDLPCSPKRGPLCAPSALTASLPSASHRETWTVALLPPTALLSTVANSSSARRRSLQTIDP